MKGPRYISYKLRKQTPWLTNLHSSAVGKKPPPFSYGDRQSHGQPSLRSSPVNLGPGAIIEAAAPYLASSGRYPSLVPVVEYGLISGPSGTKHSRISVIERRHVSTGLSSRGRRGCDEGEVVLLVDVVSVVGISGRFCGR